MTTWGRVAYLTVLFLALLFGFIGGFDDIWPMIMFYVILFATVEVVTYFKMRNK